MPLEWIRPFEKLLSSVLILVARCYVILRHPATIFGDHRFTLPPFGAPGSYAQPQPACYRHSQQYLSCGNASLGITPVPSNVADDIFTSLKSQLPASLHWQHAPALSQPESAEARLLLSNVQTFSGHTTTCPLGPGR